MTLSRRQLLSAAATSLAFAGFARAADLVESDPYRSEVSGYGPLKPDPKGLFDLPDGFSYAVVSRAGEIMSDGLIVPHKTDGMACFGLGAGKVALVRNHELKLGDGELTAFGPGRMLADKVGKDRLFDLDGGGLPLGGATTTLVWDLKAKTLVSQHLSLAGTLVNCAGGPTPRQTWLSCEETTQVAGNGTGKDHGWVFEVPAAGKGIADPEPIAAMGRFRHEATCTDPKTGIVYMTEDVADGLFYRYLPTDRDRLHAGGRLQALSLPEGAAADTRNWDGAVYWKAGDWRDAHWVDLDGVDNPHDDLRLRGRQKGAAPFARCEGTYFGEGEVYIASTSGGPGRLGQILRYRPGEAEGPGRIQLFAEPSDRTLMNMCDNIAVAPWGHLFVCEDKVGGVNYLRALTPEGRFYTVGRNAELGGGDVGVNSELAGVCFSPDGATMFVNIYSPGMTLAVTGPWGALKT